MKKRPTAALVVLLMGAVMIAIGVVRGEPDIVLHKAVRICLECIGLG